MESVEEKTQELSQQEISTQSNTNKKANRKIFPVKRLGAFLSDLILTIISIVCAIFGIANQSANVPWFVWVFVIPFLFAIGIRIYVFYSDCATKKELALIQVSEKISAQTMLVQQRASEAKVRAILQKTYGHVPEVNPMNYRENVLPYDVHEYIRTILVEIRNSFIRMAEGTKSSADSDMVTVDLVYCYPDSSNKGDLPAKPDQENPWRIITSVDASCTGITLHELLAKNDSFFTLLSKENYVFYNNKCEKGCQYVESGKDTEYDKIGSIIGMTINIKNDAPEKVLVKAILTITTYGWCLGEIAESLNERELKNLFKRKALNGYKSLLESELMQMYIRHVIRDEKMCSLTGIMLEEDPSFQSRTKVKCPLNVQRSKSACPNHSITKCQCID